jgi:competence protein ComEC
LVLCSAAIIANKTWASWTASFALLVLVPLIAAHTFRPRLDPGHLEVTVLDVGQGDSIFVAAPQGQTMLLDGGGLPGGNYIRGIRAGLDVGEDVVSPYLSRLEAD